MAIDWTKLYKKYKGMWIALDRDEKTVLGYGKSVKEAIAKAKTKSSITPILTRMPEKMTSYVGGF